MCQEITVVSTIKRIWASSLSDNLHRLGLPLFLMAAVILLLLFLTTAGNGVFNNGHAFGYAYGYGYSYGYEIVSGGGVGSTPSGTTFVYDVVNSAGQFTQSVTAESVDHKVTLDIPKGVTGKTATGATLTRIDIAPMTAPPAPPAQSTIIGLTYDFGPAGTTFNPPITLNFNYDPASLPAGTDEKTLTIAFYDTAKGAWVTLDNITVNTATHTISGMVSHFTAFAVISPPRVTPAPTATPTPTAAPAPAPVSTATVTPTSTPTPVPTPTPTTPKPTAIATPTSTPTPTPTLSATPGGANWLLIGGIIGGVVVVVLIITAVIIRRRR